MRQKLLMPLARLTAGIFIIAMTLVACDNKKAEKKEGEGMDTGDTRPVKPIDNKGGTATPGDTTTKMQ